MRNAIELLMAAIALACLGMTSMAAEPDLAGHTSASHSLALQRSVDQAVAKTLARTWSPPLQAQQLAVTAVDLSEPRKPTFASVRGTEPVYPASVIKLFYQAAVHRWMEDRKIQDTTEVRRALRDMFV